MHVSAAMTRLPKLVKYREKDLIMSDVVSPKGSGIRPEIIVDGASPRKSSAERARSLAVTLCSMIPGHSQRMFPRQAANCVWALGTLYDMGIKVTDVKEEKFRRGGTSLMDVDRNNKLLEKSDRQVDSWRDSLDGLVARLQASGMSHGFSHAYASLLEVVSANDFSAMNAHGQPSEAAQLLKGEI